jgi:hypothetical protein
MSIKSLGDTIKLETGDFSGSVKWLDMGFYIPDGWIPVLAEFKQNNVVQVGPMVDIEQAPAVEPYLPASKCAKLIAELEPVESAELYGIEIAAGESLLKGLSLEISDANEWQSRQAPNSLIPARFVDNQISCARVELKPAPEAGEQPDAESTPAARRTAPRRARRFRGLPAAQEKKGIADMLATPQNYVLVSVKCSLPAAGEAITASKLPVLEELSGAVHRPAGVIVAGRTTEEQTIYQLDYCGIVTNEQDHTCRLSVGEAGVVTESFADNIWLPQQVESVTEFFVLYLVPKAKNTVIIITAVRPGDSDKAGTVKGHEGFML